MTKDTLVLSCLEHAAIETVLSKLKGLPDDLKPRCLTLHKDGTDEHVHRFIPSKEMAINFIMLIGLSALIEVLRRADDAESDDQAAQVNALGERLSTFLDSTIPAGTRH